MTRIKSNPLVLNGGMGTPITEVSPTVLAAPGPGGDTLTGGNGNDTQHGLGGNDMLYVSQGQDVLFGDDGDDTLNGWPNVGTRVDAAADTLYGGLGNDLLYLTNGDSGDGGAGWDHVDIVYDKGQDISFTLAAHTVVRANGVVLAFVDNVEEVTITTGGGNDLIVTGAGNDYIGLSGGGADSVQAGAGDDRLRAYQMGFQADGGAGTDKLEILLSTTFTAAAAFEIDLLGGFMLADGVRHDVTGFESLWLDGQFGAVTLSGGTGSDRFDASHTTSALIHGNAGNDYLVSAGSATVYGGTGDDIIRGGGLLFGEEGNDVIGGSGAVTIYGGAGDDEISPGSSGLVDAGDGNDSITVDLATTAQFVLGAGDDLIEIYAPATGSVQAGAGNDVVHVETTALGSSYAGDAGDDWLHVYVDWSRRGGTGVLTTTQTAQGLEIRLDGVLTRATGFEHLAAQGNVGADSLGGTAGADYLDGDLEVWNLDPAQTGADTLNGFGGNDTLDGWGGADLINGGAGDDSIIGGLGSDRMTGGSGHDRFVFFTSAEIGLGAARDVIADFTTFVDKLDFSNFDTPFHFLGKAAFDGTAMALRWGLEGGNAVVRGDLNGDKVADFGLILTGTQVLHAVDFVL